MPVLFRLSGASSLTSSNRPEPACLSVLECVRRLRCSAYGGADFVISGATRYRPLGCYLRRYRLGTAKHVAIECSRECRRVARVPKLKAEANLLGGQKRQLEQARLYPVTL